MTEEELFQATSATRINDLTLRWSITQLFATLHIVAIPLVLTQIDVRTPLYLLASSTGLLAGIIWLLALQRINTWIDYWTRKLHELEEVGHVHEVRVFGDEFDSLHRSGIPTQFILAGMICVVLLIWLFFITRHVVS